MLTRRFKIMLKQDFASWILGLVQEHTWLCVQQGPLIHEGRENMGFFCLFVLTKAEFSRNQQTITNQAIKTSGLMGMLW